MKVFFDIRCFRNTDEDINHDQEEGNAEWELKYLTKERSAT